MFEFTPYFVWFARNSEVNLYAHGGQDYASVDGQSYYITGVTYFRLYGGQNQYIITRNTLKIVFNDSSMNKKDTVYSYMALSN